MQRSVPASQPSAPLLIQQSSGQQDGSGEGGEGGKDLGGMPMDYMHLLRVNSLQAEGLLIGFLWVIKWTRILTGLAQYATRHKGNCPHY